MAELDVIIEIAKGGHIKYEYDKEKRAIICDRILHTPMKYPFNYGFVPNTLSEDGDPLDAIVIMDDELVPGSYIRCQILGYLDTQDDKGDDPKLIVCPVEKVDPIWKNTTLFGDKIGQYVLSKIKYFFQHYKDLERKNVKVGDFHGWLDGIIIYNESVQRFKYKDIQKTKITDFFERI